MRTCDALARLDFHQARIEDTLVKALVLVEGEPVEARDALARERWTLVRLLREYQVFKHAEIFDPVLRTAQPARAEQARRMAANCIEQGKEFQARLHHWSARDVAAEWDAYKPTVLAMAARLRRTMAAERTGITMLLAGTERVRQLV